MLQEKEICVSVIIPIYKTEAYLIRCLESVRKQTHQNLQVLMIDDGSPDQSAEIAEKYVNKDPRFHLVRQENQGLSAARNTGLDHVAGEWIAFLDSDDYYANHMIEALLHAALSANTHMSMCGYYRCYSDIKKREVVHVKPAYITDKTELQKYFITQRQGVEAVWMKLYRRDIFEKLRFPVGVLSEDLYIRPHILDLAGSCVVIDEPLYYYRKRADSITESLGNAASSFESFLHQWIYLKKHYPQIDAFICDQALDYCCMFLGHFYLSGNEAYWKQAAHVFRREMQGAALRSVYLKGAVVLFRISPRILSKGWCFYMNMKNRIRKRG